MEKYEIPKMEIMVFETDVRTNGLFKSTDIDKDDNKVDVVMPTNVF